MILVASEGEVVALRKCFLSKVHNICISVPGFLNTSKQSLFMLETIVAITIELLQNKVFDKKNKSKSRFCHLPVSCLSNAFCAR